MKSQELQSFVASHADAVVAELIAVRGSSPRDEGAFMAIARMYEA